MLGSNGGGIARRGEVVDMWMAWGVHSVVVALFVANVMEVAGGVLIFVIALVVNLQLGVVQGF